MKRGLRWLGGVLLITLVTVVGMAIFDICPPEGPWPQPPWCPDSPFSWPFSQPDEEVLEASVVDSEPEIQATEEEVLVTMAESVFSGLSRVQAIFDQGLQGMAQYTPSAGGSMHIGRLFSTSGSGRLACMRPYMGSGSFNIPEGFTAPLPEDGYIPAPEGACGAGALPEVRFSDLAGEPVTGERLVEENIQTIDFAALIGEDPEVKSIETIITEALQPGDMRLTTPEGWNEALWEPLAAEQQPMDSLVEYQLWNTADEIEMLIADSIESRMQAMGISDIVIGAFRQSNHQNWFASRLAEPENELASMDIIAEFDGAFHGTVEEERSFTLPAPGEMPEFGPMTGTGELSFDHPELGLLNFEVELAWSEWDELGRVSGGEMQMIERSAGYEIHMAFQPDGKKEGDVYIDGELVGRVEMLIEGNETYMKFIPLD
jgi:hypothetical protein